MIPVVVVLTVALIGAFLGGFFGRSNYADNAVAVVPSVAVVSGIQNGALINSNGTIDNPDAAVYGYLAMADVNNGSLISLSNPSGKTLKSETQFLSYSSNSTSSILEAIAFKFNVPLQALQSIANAGN